MRARELTSWLWCSVVHKQRRVIQSSGKTVLIKCWKYANMSNWSFIPPRFLFSVSVTSWQKSECQVHTLRWWRTWSPTITTIMSQRGHVTSRQKYWFIPSLFLSQNLTSIQSQSWKISFQKGFSRKLGNVTWMSTFVQALEILISRSLGNNNMNVCNALDAGNCLEMKKLKLGNIIRLNNILSLTFRFSPHLKNITVMSQ